jgi:hypothetical protein
VSKAESAPRRSVTADCSRNESRSSPVRPWPVPALVSFALLLKQGVLLELGTAAVRCYNAEQTLRHVPMNRQALNEFEDGAAVPHFKNMGCCYPLKYLVRDAAIRTSAPTEESPERFEQAAGKIERSLRLIRRLLCEGPWRTTMHLAGNSWYFVDGQIDVVS